MTGEKKEALALVVDDEQSARFVLSESLSSRGQVDVCGGLAEAARLIAEREYDMIFLDINMPGGSGFDLFEDIRKKPVPPPVVVMTANATMQNAVTAMRKGAFDYITKPFDLDMVDILVDRILEYKKMAKELEEYRRLAAKSAEEGMTGRSAPMQELFKVIGRAADSPETVLVTGPTGSGKELVARALHFGSGRGGKPFITINCAAVPAELLEAELFGHVKGAFTGAVESREGKFASAGEGSILLDEIGDMPMPLQAKMLRALQEREYYPVGSSAPKKVKARVIASTNKDLEKEVEGGRFRADLYHRLNVISIRTPSLDERKEDIPLLVEAFLERAAEAMGGGSKMVSNEVMEAFSQRSWPGNVRELENAVRRAAALAPGSLITAEDIGQALAAPAPAARAKPSATLESLIEKMYASQPHGLVHDKIMSLVEKALITTALKNNGWARIKAAQELGLNRNTFAKKLSSLGVDMKERKKPRDRE